jgi:Protein of unknown function (DUF1402)
MRLEAAGGYGLRSPNSGPAGPISEKIARRLFMKRLGLLAFSVAFAFVTTATLAATLVPEGNRNAEQPPVPGASAKRTAAKKTTFEKKYQKVLALLQNDGKLRSKIKQAASQFGIDPVHVAGAIVGEHTYNVDAYDRLQTYYVKAVSYLSNSLSFEYEGESIADFVARPQFQPCAKYSDSYRLWTCREQIWASEFSGKTVDGQSFPKNRFGAVFFQPYYAGQTFGIGQLNPLTALKISDYVAQTTGAPRLDVSDPNKVYETIMDPDKTLPYVAATLRKSIDAYKSIAGFDISRNPGITATLYNTGNPEGRAAALRQENDERKASGQEAKLPEENYYGWLVNDRIADLRALF